MFKYLKYVNMIYKINHSLSENWVKTMDGDLITGYKNYRIYPLHAFK